MISSSHLVLCIFFKGMNDNIQKYKYDDERTGIYDH